MKYLVIGRIKRDGKLLPRFSAAEFDGREGVKLVAAGFLRTMTADELQQDIDAAARNAQRAALEQAERDRRDAEARALTSHTTAKRSGDQEGATANDDDAQDGASASAASAMAAAEGDSAVAATGSQDSPQRQNAGSDDASQSGNRDAQDAASGTKEGAGAAHTDEAAPKSDSNKPGSKKTGKK